MGNPNKQPSPRGPCKTCNANGGLWHDAPDTVHCLRSQDSHRHVMRGEQATRWEHECWAPVSAPIPLSAVLELLRPAIRGRR